MVTARPPSGSDVVSGPAKNCTAVVLVAVSRPVFDNA